MSHSNFHNSSNIKDLSITLLLIVCVTIGSLFYVSITKSTSNIFIFYFLVIYLISRLTNGYFWGILTSILGIFGINYYFTYPRYALNFSIKGYPFTFLSMLFVAIIISVMTAHSKKQTRLFYEREERSNQLNHMLNEINTKLLSTSGLNHIIDLTLDYVLYFIQSTVIFYSKSPQSGDIGVLRCINASHTKIMYSRHERFIAHWVFEHKKQAGVGTDFCGESSCTYLPLISHDTIWGVIGIYCADLKPIKEKDINCLNLLISQVAISIERQHLSDSQQHILIETEKEKMRANLLRAVSHDLRTPLTGMIGASETLMKSKQFLTEAEKDNLVHYIYEDSNWLLHMVENLLTVTRIREGGSSVNKALEPLEEVVSESIMRIKKRYPNSQIEVTVPDEFLLVPMDATLIEQVIINLIENALKHSKSNDVITLTTEKQDNQVVFSVADNGIGIREEQLVSVFDGFSYSENKSSDAMKGIGIGLSICKTIINAHGGVITAQNRSEGGAKFSFTLPLEDE